MRNAGLEETQAGIKIAERNINQGDNAKENNLRTVIHLVKLNLSLFLTKILI